MKKRLIISFVIFALILISIIFTSSYVQALSREEKIQIEKEILEQKIRNNEISEQQANQIYTNMEERINNCYNTCEQNENCPIYHQSDNCIRQNYQGGQRNCNIIRDCDRQQECHNRKCHR